jgi:hypothetical protein
MSSAVPASDGRLPLSAYGQRIVLGREASTLEAKPWKPQRISVTSARSSPEVDTCRQPDHERRPCNTALIVAVSATPSMRTVALENRISITPLTGVLVPAAGTSGTAC